jgi:hypothetical protein
MSTARYLDDCRDGYELVIYRDDQGDVYVSVLLEGHKIGPTVRFCASGGADHVPGLLSALYKLHAILAEPAEDRRARERAAFAREDTP